MAKPPIPPTSLSPFHTSSARNGFRTALPTVDLPIQLARALASKITHVEPLTQRDTMPPAHPRLKAPAQLVLLHLALQVPSIMVQEPAAPVLDHPPQTTRVVLKL